MYNSYCNNKNIELLCQGYNEYLIILTSIDELAPKSELLLLEI